MKSHIIKNECPKCKDVVYKDQRVIVRCEDCRCEMERSEDDREDKT